MTYSNTTNADRLLQKIRETPLRDLMPPMMYPRYMPDTPDILVLQRPIDLAGDYEEGFINHLYKAVVLETEADKQIAEHALSRPLVVEGNIIRFKDTIDKPNLRRSVLPQSRDLRVILYLPPEDGWPYVLVMMTFTTIPNSILCRERYVVSFHETLEEANWCMTKIGVASGMAGMTIGFQAGTQD